MKSALHLVYTYFTRSLGTMRKMDAVINRIFGVLPSINKLTKMELRFKRISYINADAVVFLKNKLFLSSIST